VLRYRGGIVVAQAPSTRVPFEGFAFPTRARTPLVRSGAPVPPEGSLELMRTGASWSGQLRHGGVFVEISAPSRRAVLETARALEPVRR
jgi:hypothetical protein